MYAKQLNIDRNCLKLSIKAKLKFNKNLTNFLSRLN